VPHPPAAIPTPALALSALVLAAAAPFLAPAPAHACSPLVGLHGRRVFPPDGSTAVPTNARPVVSYSHGIRWFPDAEADAGVAELGSDLQLRRKGGDPVSVTTRVVRTGLTASLREMAFVLAPRQPLVPAAEYELVDQRTTFPCGQTRQTPCQLSGPTVFTTFTTGAGPDSTAPALAGRGAVASQDPIFCESSACCGPYASLPYRATWPAAGGNDAGRALYNLYSGADPNPVAGLIATTDVRLQVRCGPGGDPNRLGVQPGPLRVSAVDWAGNEGPPLDIGVTGNPCPLVPGGGGCSYAAAHDTAAGALAAPALAGALALIVIAIRRRRGPRRSSAGRPARPRRGTPGRTR
jgi:hypothetical protein